MHSAQWHAASLALPHDETRVLVQYANGDIEVAFYARGFWFAGRRGDWFRVETPAYWQVLPPAAPYDKRGLTK